MKSPKLTVSPSELHAAPATAGGPCLPREDADSLRRLAITAGWNHQLLNTPAQVSRKCPVLPRFVPSAVGQGAIVAGVSDESDLPVVMGEASNAANDFHGVRGDALGPAGTAGKCPCNH